MKTQIVKNTIEVSKSINGTLFFFRHVMHGILPGCREEVRLSVEPEEGKIVLRPLFSHNGREEIRVEDYRALIRAATVVSASLDDIEINPTVENFARIDIEAICDCPTVNPKKFTHAERQEWYFKMVRDQNARSMDIVDRNRRKRYGSK